MESSDHGWRRTLLLVFLSGLGGAITFALCLVAFFAYFSTPGTHEMRSRQETVSDVPRIKKTEDFLGTMGSYSGHFDPSAHRKMLAAGPGEIVGTITVDGKPCPGIRVQLALNGAVMSQWGESGADGKYHIALPYGEYRLDGFQLDPENLNKRLAGKTDAPLNGAGIGSRSPFTVAAGKPGPGVHLDYIDPVVITGPTGEVSRSRPIVVSWKPYPNAASYRVQITEYKQPGGLRSERQLFEFSDQPVVVATSVNLTDRHLDWKKGYYYRIDVDALDDRRGIIATSGNRFAVTDFQIVD